MVNRKTMNNDYRSTLDTPTDFFRRDINSIPFRNFTLIEFECWRKIFVVAKKNNFSNVKFEDFMRIIYYQIALSNYKVALMFLETYQTDDIQAAFLKSKLNIIINHSRCMNLQDDISFSLKGYKPAIYSLVTVSVLNHCNERNLGDFITKLIKIETIMKSIPIDPHLLLCIENLICNAELKLKNPPIDRPVDPKLDVPKIPITSVLECVINGSVRSLVEIIRRIMKEYPKDSNELAIIRLNSSAIGETLRTKILELDYPIVTFIFDSFQNYNLEEIETSPIQLKNIIDLCVDVVYKYILNGGDNVGVIIGYLRFFSKTPIVFPEHYESICKPTLLNLYSKGLLILSDLKLQGNKFVETDTLYVYKKWKFDTQSDLEQVDRYSPIIADLMENIFGCTEIYNRGHGRPIKYDVVILKERLEKFFLILDLFPFWWKPAICIVGLNLYKKINKQHQLCFFNNLLLDNGHMRFERRSDGTQVDSLLANLVDNIHNDLFNLRDTYKWIFGEDVDVTKFDLLDKICQQLKQDINPEQMTPSIDVVSRVASVMGVVLQTHTFGAEYITHLKLHEKYQPGGKHYFSIEQHFNNTIIS